MRIFEEIINRIEADCGSYKANDNISKYIRHGELEDLIDGVEDAFEVVLDRLVIDRLNDPNSRDTARRLAKAYVNELMRGRYYDAPDITSFPNQTYTGLLTQRAEIRSLCAHHHQAMKGVAYIGIIPNGQVLGLSKYVRLAQWIARRGQIQEALTEQIARSIISAAECEDVGVYIAMSHDCVENRGVAAHSSLAQTTVLYGRFQQQHVKEEFMHNIHLQEMYTDAR